MTLSDSPHTLTRRSVYFDTKNVLVIRTAASMHEDNEVTLSHLDYQARFSVTLRCMSKCRSPFLRKCVEKRMLPMARHEGTIGRDESRRLHRKCS